MNILGLTSASGGFHDSSAVWVEDGIIRFAQPEERITKIKHDYSFPLQTIQHILKISKLKLHEFDGIAVAWKPYNPFSGFFKRSFFDVPATAGYCLLTKPVQTLNYALNNFFHLKMIGKKSKLTAHVNPEKIYYFSHHLSHAASSYRNSGFEKALSVNLDCFGPDDQGNLWSGASYICQDNNIDLIEYIPPHASLGLFYSAVSVCLGFKFGDGESKTMGLAAYGNPYKNYNALKVISPNFENGTWKGHSSWSDFRLIDSPELLFNTYWGKYLRKLIKNTSREDVAASAQKILEEVITRYFNYLLSKYKTTKIVLAGGIFLNITFNRILAERDDVSSIYIHPFPSDGGTAAGAALELYARLSGKNVNLPLTSTALGAEFTDKEIEEILIAHNNKINYTKELNLAQYAASLISNGYVIGWFQGRAEWGPRALGQRSVLGDPRNINIKDRLNRYLKKRDWFMPFAPSILEEYAKDYFENSFYVPFMTFSFRVKDDKKKIIPAVIHKDGTARPNMVRKKENPLYYELIREFFNITGVPVVLNTSFNRHGLPIVHSPQHAIDHLLWGCVDILIIGNFVIRRKNQIENIDGFSEGARRSAYVDKIAYEQALK